MWIIYVFLLSFAIVITWLIIKKTNQQQLCHQMMNMQTYHVVFVGCRHGVYDSWVGCQKNVFLDKGSVYKAYTFREEVVGS